MIGRFIALLCFLIVTGLGNPTPRPPVQTVTQNKTAAFWAQHARALSDGAKPGLVKLMGDKTFRNDISVINELHNKSNEDVLSWLVDNIRSLPVVLNTRNELFAEIVQRSYIPTHWLLQAEGGIRGSIVQDIAETKLMKFPPFTKPCNPASIAQAEDRPLYTAINLWKKAGGNTRYGDIGFVSRPGHKFKYIVAPFDTGRYVYDCMPHDHELLSANRTIKGSQNNCKAWGNPNATDFDHQPHFGDHFNFMHLIQPQVEFHDYPLSRLFKRLAGKESATTADWYFEIAYSGSFYLPEALHYTMVDFETVWGQPTGDKIVSWHRMVSRPLVWMSIKDMDNMFLDAYVGHFLGYDAVPADLNVSKIYWKAKPSWATLLNTVTGHLHFFYMRAQDVSECVKQCSKGCEFMGTNKYSKCIYTFFI